RPRRNAATSSAEALAEVLLRNPITGIAGCCAHAASGQAAAAPPSSVMNSRRFKPKPPVLPTERIAYLCKPRDSYAAEFRAGLCPVGVRMRRTHPELFLPLTPDSRRSLGGTSRSCHNRTYAPQQIASLFDHRVGALVQKPRHTSRPSASAVLSARKALSGGGKVAA